MAKTNSLGSTLINELQRRSLSKEADPWKLLDEFKEGAAGARVLDSKGDGEVSLLVPVRDGYDGPEKIQVAPANNPAKVIDSIKSSGTVEVEGIKFREFILSPLRYKGAVGAAAGDRPMLGLQGDGADGPWAPFGFADQWYWEDLLLLTDLATRGGVEVRPEVEVDPRDPDWKELSNEQRDFVEKALARRVPRVVHTSVIAEALERAGDNSALDSAMRSLTLSLEGKAPPEPAEPATPASKSLEAAKPVLTEILGAELFTAGAFPKALCELGAAVLREQGETEQAQLLGAHVRGEPAAREALAIALDRAFGVGFSDSRAVSVELIDRILDQKGPSLTFEQVDTLRSLREELDYQSEVELFGTELSERPLSTASADKRLRELYQELRARLDLDDEAVFRLATKLFGAVNVNSGKPVVIIMSGGAGAIDTLLGRAKAVLGPGVDIQGAGELRMDDPVGYLVGSPADQPGVARGALLRGARENGGRVVCSIDGLEGLGCACPDPGGQAAAQQAFWSFIAQAARDGSFRGYDPNGQNSAGGLKVPLAGGAFLLRTEQSLSELQHSMPPEVWAQLSPHVIDFGAPTATAALAELRESLRSYMIRELGVPGAEVELAPTSIAFLSDLLARGLAPKRLLELVRGEIELQLFGARFDGALAPRVRVELARGLTGREVERFKEAWLRGEAISVGGIGGCIFRLFDAGRFEPETHKRLSAKLEKLLAKDQADDKKRRTIAEYQRSAQVDAGTIDSLVAANKDLAARGVAAEHRIDEVMWLNERARWDVEQKDRLLKVARDTIAALKGDLAEANRRIAALNHDVGAMKEAGLELKEKLATAVKERDEIAADLSLLNKGLQEGSKELAARDPAAVFAQARAFAAAKNERLQQLGRYLCYEATLGALGKVRQYQGDAVSQYQSDWDPDVSLFRAAFQSPAEFQRQSAESAERRAGRGQVNKFPEIAALAKEYVQTSRALGVEPEAEILGMMEQAARLSGNGWSNRLSDDWERMVGVKSIGGGNVSMLSNVPRVLLRSLGIRI